jgi:glycosyltransferase involved in cell wall biosynthesis
MESHLTFSTEPDRSVEHLGDQQSRTHLSVVVPVYRGELILSELCRRLVAVLESFRRPYRIVLVDDRSPDKSWEVVRQMVERYPSVVGVRLSRNFGQHYAITAGLDIGLSEWTVIMDCDLQDAPEEIPALLAAAESGYDIVLARRKVRNDSLRKRILSWWFYAIFNLLSGYRMDPSVGSFRIMRHTVVEAYRTMREASRLFGGMIEWLGFETAHIDVTHHARYEGRSSYTFRSMAKLALDGVIAFSNRPLYFSIAAGIFMSFVSCGFGATLIVRYLLGLRAGVAGWLSTVTLTTFIGGLILLNLGILGIYVGRIYDQTKGRPLYVVDRIILNSSSANSELHSGQFAESQSSESSK